MSNCETVVVDYGVGNLFSVCRALEAAGAKVARSRDPRKIEAADRIVLPGVGAFGACVQRLKDFELWEPLKHALWSRRPYLGICVGMQMLLDVGEEFGLHEGLGEIPGRVVPIPRVGADGAPHKIPSIGWRPLCRANTERSWDGTILSSTPEGEHVYFVHSFMAVPDDAKYRLANVDYNGQTVCAAIQKDAIFGCQFHPEKSGPAGLAILRSFLAI